MVIFASPVIGCLLTTISANFHRRNIFLFENLCFFASTEKLNMSPVEPQDIDMA
jgi:hypothetical protein